MSVNSGNQDYSYQPDLKTPRLSGAGQLQFLLYSISTVREQRFGTMISRFSPTMSVFSTVTASPASQRQSASTLRTGLAHSTSENM